MDSNIVQFRSPRSTSSRRPARSTCVIREGRPAKAPAAPIGEASVIAFPSPEHRVLSPLELMRNVDKRMARNANESPKCRVLSPQRQSDDEWYRAFGRQLFEARIKARVSIEDAAAAAGRTVETWHRYEISGRGRLMYPLLRFARHYKIRIDDIFDGVPPSIPARSPD